MNKETVLKFMKSTKNRQKLKVLSVKNRNYIAREIGTNRKKTSCVSNYPFFYAFWLNGDKIEYCIMDVMQLTTKWEI